MGGSHLLQMVTWGNCMHCYKIMSMRIKLHVPWTVQLLKPLRWSMHILLPHLLISLSFAGPVITAQNRVQPQQRQSIASTLEVAMRGIMTCRISQAQSPRPVPSSQTPVRARTAAAESVEAAAAHTLQGMDSTAVAALFGCAGHLLRFQSKSLPKAALTESNLNHASSAQQAQQPARQAESAQGDGGRHSSSVDAASDTMVAFDLPWVLSSLTQQVAWLTDVLQLPWQLMLGKGVGLTGR